MANLEKKDIHSAPEKETAIFKCKNCGSNLAYMPKTGTLGCAHCNSSFEFDKSSDIGRLDYIEHDRSGKDWAETVVYRCNNCGSKEVISKFEIAKICPFCGTSNIVLTDELPGIAPNSVLPFKISAEEVAERFKAWIKKSFFAPRNLKKLVNEKSILGVYSPCFSFFTDTRSQYHGVLGKYYYTGTGNNRTRHLKTFSVSGTYDMSFSDILIECGPKLTQKDIDKIKPFATNQAYKYDLKYLAGFCANNYDKNVDASFEDAKKIMQDMLKRKILSQYSYDVVQSLNINTNYSNIKFNYLLLPVYICNYKYGGKDYSFYVNGQSGKIWGKKPISGRKVFGIIFVAAAIIAGAAVLVLKLTGKI
ncbi:MAG: hypothetical protein FWG51_01495 [Firmicutes bacterium]|nr:hypothetical protein [Bacillota bacterium]